MESPTRTTEDTALSAEQQAKARAERAAAGNVEFRSGVRRGIEQADKGDVQRHEAFREQCGRSAGPTFAKTIYWTESAVSSFTQITDYLKKNSPDKTSEIHDGFFMGIEHLVGFPKRGREGRESGTLEIPLPPVPYTCVYRHRESIIEILYLWHNFHGQ